MDWTMLILVSVAILGWRLRRDNAKRNELLEQISRQQTARKQSLRIHAKPKLAVKKTKKAMLIKHKSLSS